jgi:hypothetical protein
MNPFLERSWRDLHTSLITYARDSIQDSLPEALRARAEERVFLESVDFEAEGRSFSPDVIVVERSGWQGDGSGTAVSERTVTKPLKFWVPCGDSTQRYLEILDASNDNRVVTIIEFVSLSNKVSGKGRDLYLRKREDCQEANVNVVEIDFQRRGLPTTLAASVVSGLTPPPPYHVSVWRATDPEAGECYPMPLREILPIISIPLRREDPDATLDLQALINLAYRRGRYDASDYLRRPEPPFSAEDEVWIDSVLAAGK